MAEQDYWRRCGPCKKPIAYGSLHYTCSVSSCRKQVFCSRDCWSAHVPVMRHKDAWHEEAYAPDFAEASAALDEAERQRRRRLAPSSGAPASPARDDLAAEGDDLPEDILIVASKLKNYIRARSQMNTSAQVMERLSDIVRILCDQAIIRAREDGRKTVLDRDFMFQK